MMKNNQKVVFELGTFDVLFLEQNEIEKEETDVQVQQPDSDLWAGGRQMLRQYLQEVGFTDTILDARSARLRALLGGAGGDNEGIFLQRKYKTRILLQYSFSRNFITLKLF